MNAGRKSKIMTSITFFDLLDLDDHVTALMWMFEVVRQSCSLCAMCWKEDHDQHQLPFTCLHLDHHVTALTRTLQVVRQSFFDLLNLDCHVTALMWTFQVVRQLYSLLAGRARSWLASAFFDLLDLDEHVTALMWTFHAGRKGKIMTSINFPWPAWPRRPCDCCDLNVPSC